MSLRAFVRGLFRSRPGRVAPRHAGDELAEEVRDTIGPQGVRRGGSGYRVYRYLEDRERDQR